MDHNTSASDEAGHRSKSWLIYDGDCPFCSEYVRLVRLRQAIGPVELVNARDHAAIVDEIINAGFDLNDGMALKFNGQIYHGADCVHMLALLSSPTGFFNRFNALVFRSTRLSKIIYPILRAGRNASLKLLGRAKVDAGDMRS